MLRQFAVRRDDVLSKRGKQPRVAHAMNVTEQKGVGILLSLIVDVAKHQQLPVNFFDIALFVLDIDKCSSTTENVDRQEQVRHVSGQSRKLNADLFIIPFTCAGGVVTIQTDNVSQTLALSKVTLERKVPILGEADAARVYIESAFSAPAETENHIIGWNGL